MGTVFAGFVYRFNRARDLVAFCVATRRLLDAHGSLGAFFAAGFSPEDAPWRPALERFVAGFLETDLRAVFPRGRLSYGYRHFFPRPSTGGPCKRLLLFLRWMVRREPPDFGLWRDVPPSALLMPVDTHIEHMARAVGLTRRRSRNWRMAEEITGRLRLLDPDDPVKYDFALCHKRMSGDCRGRRDAVVCAPCGLRPVCVHWRGRRAARPGAPADDRARGDPRHAGRARHRRPRLGARPDAPAARCRSRRHGGPAPVVELLQRQIEAVRAESRAGQDGLRQEVGELGGRLREDVGALRLAVAGELKGVSAEVTRQLAEGMRLIQSAQSSMGERLDRATKVVGEVQREPRQARRGHPAGGRGRA